MNNPQQLQLQDFSLAVSAPPPTPADTPRDGLFRRAARNAGLVLGGKSVGSVAALAYLALAARALGAEAFGIVVLIHTTMVLMTRLISFKSFQAIVKYGADYREQNQPDKFQRLIKFTLALDLAGGVLGTLTGVIVIQTLGATIGLPAEATTLASLYCLLIILNINATPSGILRLFDRFDLIAWYTPVEALVRLAGVLLASLFDAPWQTYLLVWFIARVASSVALMALAWSELARQQLLQAFDRSWRGLTRDHAGIWSFVWSSNLHGTVSSVGPQLATLAVGAVLGPAGAALFRIAQEIADVTGKAAQVFNNALYRELATLVSATGSRGIQKIITRAGRAGLLIGGGVTVLLVLAGEPLLAALFGGEFRDAYPVLILLSIAATIGLTVFPFEPALYVVGKPQVALYLKTITTTVHLAALYWLLKACGLIGAGYAALVANALSAILLLAVTRVVLRRDTGSA